MRRLHRSVVLALIAASLASVASADDLDATIEKCNACHGDNGVSAWDDMPTIAGIDAFVGSEALYIYRDEARPCAMSAFRNGMSGQPDTNMCKVVADMSDDTIDAIAEHYAALPFVPAKQEFDADKAAAGQAIHDRDCERCHSDGGSNAEDEASILAGQWMGYLRTTFAEYRADEREQLGKMKEVMDALSAEDEEALLHYYASQQ